MKMRGELEDDALGSFGLEDAAVLLKRVESVIENWDDGHSEGHPGYDAESEWATCIEVLRTVPAVLARMGSPQWLPMETLVHQHISDTPLTMNGKIVPATYTSDPVILTNGRRVWVERSVIMGGARSSSADKFTAYPSGDKPTHWMPLPAAPSSPAWPRT